MLTLATLLVVALTGCGSDGKQSAPTPADPGREVMKALVAAAADGDAEAAWDLLSQPSQRREGPTVEEFEQGAFPELQRLLAPFAEGALPVQVSENLDGEFGLVAGA